MRKFESSTHKEVKITFNHNIACSSYRFLNTCKGKFQLITSPDFLFTNKVFSKTLLTTMVRFPNPARASFLRSRPYPPFLPPPVEAYRACKLICIHPNPGRIVWTIRKLLELAKSVEAKVYNGNERATKLRICGRIFPSLSSNKPQLSRHH